ncbi:hypothetical protein ACFR99_09115 [Haloarchaeobius amylolyticus]|uniref:DUF4382 domain-containing protein n=1 Tax=Haloarchaeobius amylolyticus TaxID=1198296 RepID=A0ABD6BF64_9EURY
MHSRRDVLRTGAGVAGTGLLTALAGCSEVPVVGSFFGFDYTEWVYDPNALDSDSVMVVLMNVETILDADDVPDKGDLRDQVTNNYSGELMADDVEYSLSVGNAEILTGSFDVQEIVDGMRFDGDGSHGDFDLYTDDDEEGAVIATDGEFLVRASAFEADTAREEIELLIDTYNGDADRFADVNDDFDQVQGEVDTDDFVFITGQTESATEDAADDTVVTTAITAEIDGEDTNGTYLLLYASEDGIDLDEAESDIESELSEEAELNDVSQDGRLVTAEFTTPTEDF